MKYIRSLEMSSQFVLSPPKQFYSNVCNTHFHKSCNQTPFRLSISSSLFSRISYMSSKNVLKMKHPLVKVTDSRIQASYITTNPHSSSSSSNSIGVSQLNESKKNFNFISPVITNRIIPLTKLMLFSFLIFSTFHSKPAIASESVATQYTFNFANKILKDAIPVILSVLSFLKDQGLLLFFLLFLSAIFSMAETSIMNLSPWKIKELSEKESVFGLLKQDITRFLTTILFGTTVVNILATALVTQAATRLFGNAGVSAATGVMTVLLLLLTEIAPKSIAMHNATEIAKILVRPIYLLSKILYPVGKACAGISQALLKLLGLNTTLKTTVSEEELKLFLRRAESSGAIKEEEQDIIENVLEIKDIRVNEIMTPLINMIAIDASNSLSDFRELWIKNQFSRVPVFENRVDNIVGIAYAMDLLTNGGEVSEKVNVGKIARRPAYFVPESMSVRKLLKELKKRKIHMAIVLNEYGGTVGLVTLEDVVEEIVGENFDELDSKDNKRKKAGQIVLRSEKVFDIDASTSIEDFSETLNVFVPEEPFNFDTVSGFVCGIFGKVPKIGESKKVKLLKLKQESNDWMEGEEGEDEKEKDPSWILQNKFLNFEIEILAGDERRVRVVRFKQVDDDAEGDVTEEKERKNGYDGEEKRKKEE